MQKPAKPNKTGVNRDTIVKELDRELRVSYIKDSSCNGLQVQGTKTINRIGLAVDACMAAYEQASKHNCQLLITHHGIIWNGLRSITGASYMHIKQLLDTDLNLYAAHLPLDLHPVLGNNAQLARMLGLQSIKPFGLYHGVEIGFEGELTTPLDVANLSDMLKANLHGETIVLPFGKKKIKRVAIISGGAANELTEAIEKNVDCYITGEPAHQNYHAALEAKINVIYCGHYHSEKAGVQALGKMLEKKFGVESLFFDIPTGF